MGWWYVGNYQHQGLSLLPLGFAFVWSNLVNGLKCRVVCVGITSVARLVGQDIESLGEKYWENYAMIKFQCHDQGATET